MKTKDNPAVKKFRSFMKKFVDQGKLTDGDVDEIIQYVTKANTEAIVGAVTGTINTIAKHM